MRLHASQNQLLSALPPQDRLRLQPELEWVEMPRGTLLYEAGAALSHAHFPATAVVSLTAAMQDGGSAEIAVVGPEGVVGVCAFMGTLASLSGAVVVGEGHGWRIKAATLKAAAQQSSALMQGLLGYTQALFGHMAQTSACGKAHALDQQLCSWLLQHLDRLQGSELRVTQERIAQLLGVRREGVTMGALRLQKAGLIRYGRGHIVVLDRAGIEERSCECYAVVKGAYQRLSAAPAQHSHPLMLRAA
jgi:CRP-like cAMP-binding protein